MSPSKALRLALARSADKLLEMPLTVGSVERTQSTLEEALSSFSDDTLLILLEGADGAAGAISLDRQFLTGLIEHQTTGRVTAAAPEERKFTATDAAITMPLIDDVLQRLQAAMAGDEAESWTSGFRFGARIPDCRTFGLVLRAPDYHVFRLSAMLGNAVREGEMVLALPISEIPPDSVAKPGDPQSVQPKMSETALRVRVELQAVLCRVQIPLSQAGQLKPGDIVDIPRDALSDTAIMDGAGKRIARARLGQLNGFRAVRLATTHSLPRIQTAATVAKEEEPDGTFSQRPAQPAPVAPPRPETPPSDVEALPDLPPLDMDDLDELGDLPAA